MEKLDAQASAAKAVAELLEGLSETKRGMASEAGLSLIMSTALVEDMVGRDRTIAYLRNLANDLEMFSGDEKGGN